MTNGYNFYFATSYGLVTFPITPAELNIKNGSNNDVVNLINEGDVNILKSPSLMEIEFEARFPMRKYPYSREVRDFEAYFNIFKKVKENKQSFRFIVARTTPKGSRTWDTNLLVSLEELSTNEDAEEGDDVIVSFTLKQYKEYGVKTYKNETTSTSNISRSTNNAPTSKSSTEPGNSRYIVKKGDNLWNIAKKEYGDGTQHTAIYNANKNVIEDAAKKNGKASSSNGHWIYPKTELRLPHISK